MTQYGTVIESSDGGITWTRRNLNPAPASPAIYEVLGNGDDLWVTSGAIVTPLNFYAGAPAVHWAKGNGPSASRDTSCIAFGDGVFVGAGFTEGAPDQNEFASSADGISWTSRTSTFDFNQNTTWALEYSEDLGLFVALGQCRSGFILPSQEVTSPDGITWTDQGEALTNVGIDIGDGFGIPRNSLKWIERLGLFVFVASVQPNSGDNAATSPDGLVWTPTQLVYSTRHGNFGLPTNATSDASWVGIDDDGTQTIVVVLSIGDFMSSFRPYGSLFSSTDGATWMELASQPPDAVSPVGIAYGDGTWVVIGQPAPLIGDSTPYVYTSTDGGTTWIEQTVPSDFESPTDIKFQNGVFVIVGQTPTPPPSASGWNVGRIVVA